LSIIFGIPETGPVAGIPGLEVGHPDAALSHRLHHQPDSHSIIFYNQRVWKRRSSSCTFNLKGLGHEIDFKTFYGSEISRSRQVMRQVYKFFRGSSDLYENEIPCSEYLPKDKS
jgi:hypothetical protein